MTWKGVNVALLISIHMGLVCAYMEEHGSCVPAEYCMNEVNFINLWSHFFLV